MPLSLHTVNTKLYNFTCLRGCKTIKYEMKRNEIGSVETAK